MDKLTELRYKKTRQQLRYIQTEFEETKIIYDDCVDKFNIEFKDSLMETPPEETDHEIDNPYHNIDSDVSKKTLSDLYKKLAVKVHPDKQTGDEEVFKTLNRANRNSDYGLMMEMAEELEIEISNDEETYNNNKKQIRAIIEAVKNMQSTFAWQWEHIEDDQRPAYKDYILKQMEL